MSNQASRKEKNIGSQILSTNSTIWTTNEKKEHGTLYSLFPSCTAQLFVFLLLRFVFDVYIIHTHATHFYHIIQKSSENIEEKNAAPKEFVVLNYIAHTCAFETCLDFLFWSNIVAWISEEMNDEASVAFHSQCFRHTWTFRSVSFILWRGKMGCRIFTHQNVFN